ncbi:VOC family protein [Kytococcus sp. Marseille-QA3725]
MTEHTNMLSPYIQFNGRARQALEFYASVLGGTPRILTFGEAGVEGMGAPEAVMHGQLETEGGYVLMAADGTRPEDEVVRGGMNLVLWGSDEATLRGYFDGLARGGRVNMPMEKQMWGDVYGDLTDRFGINWGFNVGTSEPSV